MLKGGQEYVGVALGTGNAVGMTVNGGLAVIRGTASGTTVTNGGVLTVLGVDSHASVVSGGTTDVAPGGTDSGTSVTGGTMNVASGGTADATSISSSGTMNVGVGGDAATASGVSVGSGGTLNVSAGGVVSGLTIKDANDPGVTATANVLSGGTVDGRATIDGGQLIFDAGAVYQPHTNLFIMNTGWLVLEQEPFRGIIIHDFGGSDELDLTKIRFIGQGIWETTATFTQTSAVGGALDFVAQGVHSAPLHFAGTYTTANFALASDGAHGTLVTFVPNASLAGHG